MSHSRIPTLAVILALFSMTSTNRAQSLKVAPQPGRVIPGVYNITDVNGAYDRMTVKSDGQRPPIAFTFFDWNSAGIDAPSPVLQDFNDPLPGSMVSPLELAGRMADQGAVLAVAWDAVGYIHEHPEYAKGTATRPVDFTDIFDGVYDDYIRTVARQIRDFGQPIMISPAAEFNAIGVYAFGDNGTTFLPDETDKITGNYGSDLWPDGPERVRDLYRHVIDIFHEEQADNVTWFMYSHTSYMNPAELDPNEIPAWDWLHPELYYPGDEYIDWVGNSAYISADDPKLDLEYAIGHAIDAFREFTDKPVFAPEFGVTSESGASRAARMAQLFGYEMQAVPELDAFAMADDLLFELFFDLARLGNHANELDVWNQVMWDNPYYAGTAGFQIVPEPNYSFDRPGSSTVPEPNSFGLVYLLIAFRSFSSVARKGNTLAIS